MRSTKAALLTILWSLALGGSITADAQSDKPLRLIVTSSPGSAQDAVSRLLGPPMSKALGQPVVVENVPGASGTIGTQQVARSPKDGNTIGMVSSNHVINPAIYPSLPYDSVKGITPITIVGTIPMVLVVHPSVPAKDLKEFIALAKTKELSYASGASVLQLAGQLFKEQAGIEMTIVPYKGAGAAVTDVIGGHVPFGIFGVSTVASYVKAGKLRALGVSTAKRSPLMPEVPTIAEQGLPKYSFDAWFAILGPPGLPKAQVDRIYSAIKTALATKEVQEGLVAQGIEPVASSPETTPAFVESEVTKHVKLSKDAGLKAE